MNNSFCQDLAVDNIKDDLTLISWIEEKAKQYQLKYLLAHADDGIIWGRFDIATGKLIIAHEAFEQFPKLKLIPLQQCRIFGNQGEVLIWQTDEGLKARLIQDNPEIQSFSEEQILWGTHVEKKEKGFTLLADGSQGLKHAVPLYNPKIPVHLVVYHYIKYDDDTGIARIFFSRLVDIK